MKKIINSILAFVTLFSVTSCDLDMDPETAIRPEDAYTMEYCEGVRGPESAPFRWFLLDTGPLCGCSECLHR